MKKPADEIEQQRQRVVRIIAGNEGGKEKREPRQDQAEEENPHVDVAGLKKRLRVHTST